MKFILTLLCLLVYGNSQNPCLATDSKAYIEAGKRYIQFMINVGQAQDEESYLSEIPILFSENCQKIENGTILFKTSNGFQSQLKAARKAVGVWNIRILDLLP